MALSRQSPAYTALSFEKKCHYNYLTHKANEQTLPVFLNLLGLTVITAITPFVFYGGGMFLAWLTCVGAYYYVGVNQCSHFGEMIEFEDNNGLREERSASRFQTLDDLWITHESVKRYADHPKRRKVKSKL